MGRPRWRGCSTAVSGPRVGVGGDECPDGFVDRTESCNELDIVLGVPSDEPSQSPGAARGVDDDRTTTAGGASRAGGAHPRMHDPIGAKTVLRRGALGDAGASVAA